MDTQHIMVEQSTAWPTAVRLLAPKTVALCVKSFKWEGDTKVDVPLGQGRVKKAIVDQVLATHAKPLPICIHNEWWNNGRLAPVPFAGRGPIVEAFRADAAVLRGWLGVG